MAARDAGDRQLIARIGGLVRWANEADPTAATAPARQAFMGRFEREVDPDERLDPDERARRADLARRAYFTRLALKSAQVRRKPRP